MNPVNLLLRICEKYITLQVLYYLAVVQFFSISFRCHAHLILAILRSAQVAHRCFRSSISHYLSLTSIFFIRLMTRWHIQTRHIHIQCVHFKNCTQTISEDGYPAAFEPTKNKISDVLHHQFWVSIAVPRLTCDRQHTGQLLKKK